MEKKQETLRERLRRARRRRKLAPREGHEISAHGREMRTPTTGEFFGNLEKASKPEVPADELSHPKQNQNGGIL